MHEPIDAFLACPARVGAFSRIRHYVRECLYYEAYTSIGQETEREAEAETERERERERARARGRESERESERERERDRETERGRE